VEWAQLLVGLVGGGVGGTILGRVWDNHREDRFRHVEQKRELAAEYLRLTSMLIDARERADSLLERNPELTETEAIERMLEAYARTEEEANLWLLLAKMQLVEKQIQFLFGSDVIQTARTMNQTANAIFIGKYKPEVHAFASSDVVANYVISVRQELGVDARRPWRRRKPSI